MSLRTIKERVEAATPGPWAERAWDDGVPYITAGPDDDTDVVADWVVKGLDPAFIAHARTDIPALLGAVPSADDLDAFADLLDWHHAAHSARGGHTEPTQCWVSVCVDNARRIARLRAALADLEALP